MTVFNEDRAVFRSLARGGRKGVIRYTYSAHLASNFPTFAVWLNRHVRSLRDDDFPLEDDDELVSLHCPPSEHAILYTTMWSHGCHYRCNPENGPTHVAFDSGIAGITPESVNNVIDVGILRRIILVSYGRLKTVVMEGSWIKVN